MEDFFNDDFFMNQALKEAQRAFDEDEVPIGAVVVHGKQVIGRGYNQTEKLKDVTAHAEMIAITSAANFIGSKYLEECVLYVTLEPCVMCMGAIKHSRISKVVFGATEEKTGYSIFLNEDYSKKIEIMGGVKKQECSQILQDFFKSKR